MVISGDVVVIEIEKQFHGFMEIALEEAEKARKMAEVPIGAVLVDHSQKIIARGANQPVSRCDPTAHAEMIVLRKAARIVENYRLLSTTLYVTVEPCIMCMGALIHARVARIVFGASDLKWGAGGSLYDFTRDERLNHHPEIIGGVLEQQCRSMLVDFFKQKRTRSEKSEIE